MRVLFVFEVINVGGEKVRYRQQSLKQEVCCKCVQCLGGESEVKARIPIIIRALVSAAFAYSAKGKEERERERSIFFFIA